MEKLTVAQARAFLMEEDILPMSAVEGEDAGVGHWAESESDQEGESESDAESLLPVEGAVGLGMDIVEIERMKSVLSRRPRFAEQVFSPAEREFCAKKASPAIHYALRFAAKEAVAKAFGAEFSDCVAVDEIEVEYPKNGKPAVNLTGGALEIAREQGIRDLSLSMSYTHTDAVACVMAVTDSAVKASEKRKDPMEELARQFKETRKMLDEL